MTLLDINAEKATRAYREAIRRDECVAKFRNEILVPLGIWREGHRDKVLHCYVLIPNSPVIPVYMIGISEQYNFELTKELSQLTSEFDRRGWSVHASQIPRCDVDMLSAYFDVNRAVQIDG